MKREIQEDTRRSEKKNKEKENYKIEKILYKTYLTKKIERSVLQILSIATIYEFYQLNIIKFLLRCENN